MRTVVEYVKKVAPQYDVVSFDIFDTLIFRACGEPRGVFDIVGHELGLPDFAERRIKAEAFARKRSSKEEVSIQEIYQYLEVPIEIKSQLLQKELEVEERVCFVNPTLLNLFLYLLHQGKRIFCVSDMYLPKSFLEKLLAREGYAGYEGLIVSSEEGVQKASGRLFDRLVERYALSPSRILHLGDNYDSDCVAARSRFIDAVHVPLNFRKLLSWEPRFMRALLKFEDRELRDLICAISERRPQECSEYWESFARSWAPLVYASICRYVHEEAQRYPGSQVVFVARDGFVLKKIYDFLFPGNKSTYLFLSRGVQIIYQLDEDDRYENLSTWDRTILRRWFSSWLGMSFDSEDVFLNWLKDHHDVYKSCLSVGREHLSKYVTDRICSKHVVMFDSITNNYTSQYSLQKILGQPVHGIYVRAAPSTKKFDCSMMSSNAGDSEVSRFLEFMMTSSEPTAEVVRDGKVIFSRMPKGEAKRGRVFEKYGRELQRSLR